MLKSMTMVRVVGGFLLMLWAAAPMADTELYKWVDKDGVVHFSDKPAAGAEKITVGDVPTIPAEKPEKPGAAPQSSGARHYQVTFTSPKGDEAIRQNEGNVDVGIQLTPPLNAGDTIQFSLDGQPQGEPSGATDLSLTNLDRGTHTVEATVRDPNGKTLGSASTTFTIQRFSTLNKPPKKK